MLGLVHTRAMWMCDIHYAGVPPLPYHKVCSFHLLHYPKFILLTTSFYMLEQNRSSSQMSQDIDLLTLWLAQVCTPYLDESEKEFGGVQM